MVKILLLLLVDIMCLCFVSNAQTYYPITHLSDTQNINGITVTVTPKGSASSFSNFCGASPYWIGTSSISGAGSYTFTFSAPVANVKLQITAMNVDEIISFIVDDAPYTLTPANLLPYTGTCNQFHARIVGGNLEVAPGTPMIPGAGGEVNIPGSISSLEVNANGVQDGSVFSIYFGGISVNSNSPLCSGDALKLFILSEDIPGATYSWTGPGGFRSNAQSPEILDASIEHEGMYIATITTATDIYIDSTYVTITPTPITTIVYDDPACAGKDIQLSDTTTLSGVSYQWKGPNEFSDTIPSPVIPNVQSLHSGVYTLTTTLGACYYTAEATINVQPPLPSLFTSGSCGGASNGKAWLNADSAGNYSVVWRNSDNDILSVSDVLTDVPSGSYNVHITSIAGCDTTLTFYIPNYKVSFRADTLVCTGDAVQFDNTSDLYFDTWHWSFGDNDSSVLENPTHAYNKGSSYKVMLAGKGQACSDTAYKTITIDALLDEFSFLPDRKEICMGETIYFTPDADSTTVSLHWIFGDQAGSFSTGVEVVQHAYNIPGIMHVQLHGQFRVCPDIIYTDSVIIYDFPKVDLGQDAVLCLHRQPIVLKNHYPREAGHSYQWSTGATEQEIKVVHHGEYGLMVTNEYGCTTQESIIIDKDCYSDIPNAFTPNRDGVNDYFFPRQFLSGSITSFRFQIFNRWGQVIFETTHTDGRGWDGRFNGKDQPAGVYIYLIDVAFDNGITEQYKGNVTLMK